MTTHPFFRVAVAQYDIGEFRHWDQYAAKLAQWTRRAVDQGAQLLVFPEYASMELVSLVHAHPGLDLAAQLHALQQHLLAFIDLHRTLACTHQVYIVAASFPVCTQRGIYHNRVHVFSPHGAMGVQDKLHMTRFETERWGISAAQDI